MRHTVGCPLGAQAGPTLDTADVEWLSMGIEPGGGQTTLAVSDAQ
jgi:hypothetical protein